jgi:beta-galactosidase/beta-glucuronidase
LINDLSDETMQLTTPWTVRFQKKGNTPIEVSFSELESWHRSNNESVKHFSGTAAYTNYFSITKEQRSGTVILLELNKVREIADVFLNGEKLGTHWYKEQQFDITDKVIEGKNILTVEVVNSINNALIGDAQRPEQFRAYKSNISKLPNAWKTPFAEAPLIEAGLLGPVQIRVVKKIE